MRVLELVSIDHNSVQVKRNNSVQVVKKKILLRLLLALLLLAERDR